MKKETPKVEFNHPGWWAIRHREGWWPGTDKGVPCYEDLTLAQAALTIVWQRDGGGKLNWKLEKFTKVNTITGQYTPELSTEEALKKYEAEAKNN